MDERTATTQNGERGRGWPGVVARLGIGILLLALLGVGIYLWRERTGGAAGAPGHTAPGPLPVSIVEVRPQSVTLTPRFLGRTEASQTVQIRARVNGFLEARKFEEGSVVEAGQVLFEIDRRPFEAELAVARARLENARARAARARRQVERLQVAADQGAASATELDQQLTEEQVALSDVRLEEARVYQAELDLSYTSIVSPIRGVIGRALRDVGSYVQAGAGDEALLAVVQQIDPIYVTYSISEQELLRWRRLIASGAVVVSDPGRIALAVELADGTPYPHVGYLNFIGTQIETTTATTVLRGAVPNPDRRLLPGQFVRVQPLNISRPSAILIPQRALLQSPGGASVYVVAEDGTAQARPVVAGDWAGDAVVIEEGLQPGDRVIADHLSRMRPGTPVQVTEVLPPPAPPTPQPSSPVPAAPGEPAQ